MPTLNSTQIAGLAWNAGFRGGPLETAVAVALGESSGRTEVVNSIGCVGLWQINTRAWPQYSVAAMKDPQANANAAYAISNGGTDWHPWEVYTKRSYLLFVPQAKAGVTALQHLGADTSPSLFDRLRGVVRAPIDTAAGVVDAAQGAAEGVTQFAQFPAKVLAWISDRNNMIRVSKVVVGTGLVVAGMVVVSRPITVAAKALKVAV